MRSLNSFRLFTAAILVLAGSRCSPKNESVPDVNAISSPLMLSEAQLQLANINTSEVRMGTIGRNLTLTGILKVNEQSSVSVGSWVSGRIDKLYFKNSGEKVSKGDTLFDLFSEDIVTAQREFIRLKSNNWNFSANYEPRLAAEERLLIMGMLPFQIRQLEKDSRIRLTIPIYSSVNGKIRRVNITEGEYIERGQTLFELADESRLWVEAQVYPDEVQFIRTGMPVTVNIPATGDRFVKSVLSFVNPSFETGKNITIARVEINNPGKHMYPGMLALINVLTQKNYGMIVPTSSLITGKEGTRIWIKEESGGFTYKNVIPGLESGDSTLILSGLDISDRIVTSGAYLLNSELILKQGPIVPVETGLKDVAQGRSIQH